MSSENFGVGGGGNDEFFDAVSTTSQDNNTTPDPTPTLESRPLVSVPKRTVVSYSERNGLASTSASLNHPHTTLDPYDDFVLSNKLNSITLSSSLELHRLVFENDLGGIRTYISRQERRSNGQRDLLVDYLSIRDLHGNTPLHLATMLGHLDAAKLLTEKGAVVKARNKQLWTPLNEAISFGDRELIRNVLVKFEREVDQILADSKPKIVNALEDMLDFYVEVSRF